MRLLEAEPRKLLPYLAGMSGAAHGPVIRVAPPALHIVRHGHGGVDPPGRVDAELPGPGVLRVWERHFDDDSYGPTKVWIQTAPCVIRNDKSTCAKTKDGKRQNAKSKGMKTDGKDNIKGKV